MNRAKNSKGRGDNPPVTPHRSTLSTSPVLFLRCLLIEYLVYYTIWTPQNEYFSEVINYLGDGTRTCSIHGTSSA